MPLVKGYEGGLRTYRIGQGFLDIVLKVTGEKDVPLKDKVIPKWVIEIQIANLKETFYISK